LKKFLFSTTALAVAGAFAFGSDANAAAKPIKIGVGGFMNAEMGIANNEGGFEGSGDTNAGTKRSAFNTVQDSEIYFTGSSKLDNGTTVSITVQLEADQARTGTIDESYMKLTGGFGDLRLGSVAGVTTLKHTAPYIGVRLDFGGTENYISAPAGVTTTNHSGVDTRDDNKIVYYSPRTAGWMIGASFTPSTTNSDLAPRTGGTAGTEAEVYGGGVSFETKMGTTDVKADVLGSTSSADTAAVRAGINISAGGITFGGSYMNQTDFRDSRKDLSTSQERTAYDLGVSYAMGAHTFGISHAVGTADVGAGLEDKENKWGLGWQYALDTGVTTTVTYVNADYNDGNDVADTANNSGHALIGQIKVSF